MTQTPAQFRDKFRVPELALHAVGGWTVSLRPRACTLGACVLSVDRPRLSLAEIDADEAAALPAAVAWFERAARAAFGADRFNYLALMMVDDQLHFHALPRYAAPREFAGITWTDGGWPGQPDLSHDPGADDAALMRVRDSLIAGGAA